MLRQQGSPACPATPLDNQGLNYLGGRGWQGQKELPPCQVPGPKGPPFSTDRQKPLGDPQIPC